MGGSSSTFLLRSTARYERIQHDLAAKSMLVTQLTFFPTKWEEVQCSHYFLKTKIIHLYLSALITKDQVGPIKKYALNMFLSMSHLISHLSSISCDIRETQHELPWGPILLNYHSKCQVLANRNTALIRTLVFVQYWMVFFAYCIIIIVMSMTSVLTLKLVEMSAHSLLYRC